MGRTVTKSIAIIGEGETEWFYFDSLRVACRYPFKVAPDFPQHSDINHILKLVESYLNKQYDYIVVNDDLGACMEAVNGIVRAEHQRPNLNLEHITNLKEELNALVKGEN